ncbi:DUF6046 domain-containing protein [Fibrella sp. WM1]|uniref:DUF6046 domain-containing protein n=1 Tax=Fibrella musci TaxID=3242485 RepID=UPI00351FF472
MQTALVPHTGIVMRCPVGIRLKQTGEYWTLPIEPTISIRASKTIIKRQVNSSTNRAGTVKEQWSVDDYQISVSGLFQGEEDTYPEEDVERLDRHLRLGQPLYILSEILAPLGITQLVVESWEFPFTPGVENQQYTFSGSSDSDIELLITPNRPVTAALNFGKPLDASAPSGVLA